MDNKAKSASKYTLPEPLRSAFQKIDADFLAKSRKQMRDEGKENSKKLEKSNEDLFALRKDLLILAGTIFGSSIALAAGRNVNSLFIVGEFFLFLSIIVGLIILLTRLKAEEWDYAFSEKNSLELFLISNKNKIEKFEREQLEDLVTRYKKIIDSNQSGILYFFLKIISVEKWPAVFDTLFLIGLFFILMSIIPQQVQNIIINIITH